jgi:hypothetical protein
MTDDKAPLYLSLVAAALMTTALLTLQPYTADPWGRGFGKPAERYVRAALAQDSVALARLSVSDSPVIWALAAARRSPRSLAGWAHHTEAWTGERRGDTTQIFLFSAGSLCRDVPIQFRFVGARSGAKVVGASSDCLDSVSNTRGSGPRSRR